MNTQQNLKALKPILVDAKMVDAKDFFKTKSLIFDPNLSYLILVETPQGPKVVNFCSKNYALVKNQDLIIPVLEKLQENHNVEVKASHSDFSKFYVDFIIKDQVHKLQKDDIFPRMRLYNSYDGSMRYSFGFGFYRLVCENGMSVPVSRTNRIKLMHTPAIANGAAVVQTMSILDKFLSEAKNLLGGYKPLFDKKLNWGEAIARIEEAIEETNYPKSLVEPATIRLKQEVDMKLPLNDYLVYNALNYALYNNDSKQKLHKRDKDDLEVLTYLLTN